MQPPSSSILLASLLTAFSVSCAPVRGNDDGGAAGPDFDGQDVDGDGALTAADLDPGETAVVWIAPDGALASIRSDSGYLISGGMSRWTLTLNSTDGVLIFSLYFENSLPLAVGSGVVVNGSVRDQAESGFYAFSDDVGQDLEISAYQDWLADGRLGGPVALDVLDPDTEAPTGEQVTMVGLAFRELWADEAVIGR